VTCTSCGAENREGARFCDSCGAALAVAARREQRKVVTVLFCDVSGSTAFAESRDPEAVRAVMGRYFDVARTAIERHGGTVEKFIGDAVMAVFGVPTIREDDALRAVRAAAELRDAVEVPVRIGVNTGEVVTGSGDSLVTGDAVNVAARLEHAAAPGEVLLGDATFALVRDAVDAELLPPLDAKGKSEPLTVYRLVAVTGETAVARRLDAPFIGRVRERALLAGAWERAASERACALFTILGTAGVGKSRLASEFLAGIDATVVAGRCLSYGEGITYWPVVEVVKRLLGDRPPPDRAVAALLGDGVAAAEDIALSVRRLFEAVAAERPLVVVFDDVQWGEQTFLDLVEQVADWSRGAPILLLCLARPELLELRPGWGGGKLNATTVLLEPLDAAETDDLIDALVAGADLDAPLRDKICAAAEGNPLFVELMLAMIDSSPGEVTVPGSIRALLAARLDQLSAPERAALERGAVEGQVFHRGAVVALTPDDPDVPKRLLGLVRKELVRPSVAAVPGDEAFRFRHLLIRDAAYDALPKATRAELHHRFADWLEEHAPGLVELDEIVGYHLERAARYAAELGAPPDALELRAAKHLAAAGERSVVRDDAHAAVSLLRRAADLLPAGRERSIVLGRLGLAYELLGQFDDAYAVLDDAIATGGEDGGAFAYFIKIAVRGHGEGAMGSEVERDARAKLAALAPTGSDVTLASGYTTLALMQVWLGRIADSLASGMRALEHARRAGDRDFEQKAMGVLGMAKTNGPTPWEDVLAHADAMAALGLRSVGTRAMALAAQGRFDESRALFDERVGELRERGARSLAAGQAIARGWFELVAGDLERGLQLLCDGWTELGELGERGVRSTVGALYADLLARAGRPDEAEEILAEVERIAGPDDFLTACQATAARALVASARGEHERAVELVRSAVSIADAAEYATQRHDAWMELGEVLLAAGRADEARDALATARGLAVQKGSTAIVDRIDALLTELAATP
jgi:class 3 adenylate cyclase/tetratricopeptide (TPR) repeat protein